MPSQLLGSHLGAGLGAHWVTEVVPDGQDAGDGERIVAGGLEQSLTTVAPAGAAVAPSWQLQFPDPLMFPGVIQQSHGFPSDPGTLLQTVVSMLVKLLAAACEPYRQEHALPDVVQYQTVLV
jgi:hypothetical protein